MRQEKRRHSFRRRKHTHPLQDRAEGSPPPRRLASVDVLRAVAILLMIQVHFVENLSPRVPRWAALYDLSGVLGMLPAPIFTFLTGLSLWLWLQKQAALGREETRIVLIVVRRGLFLFGLGLAFAVAIWLPISVFDWDILTLIGAATLILLPLRDWSPSRLTALSLLILAVSPPLRAATGYAAHWRGEEYLYDLSMKDTVWGFLLQGYFPLLPWLVFPLLGFATGKLCFQDDGRHRLAGWHLPLVGTGLIALAALGSCLHRDLPRRMRTFIGRPTFYPASTTFVVGTLGLILVALWTLYRALDRRAGPPRGKLLSFLQRYSRFSLTTYVVHHAAHVWPLLLLAAWKGHSDPWWYYGEAVSTPVALALALAFIGTFYGILTAEKRWRRYSLERLLRWFSEG